MTEIAGGEPRPEDGPEALRTDENETETEIAIGGRGPGIVISAGPVQEAGAASGTRGARGMVAEAVAEAETEIEEGAIGSPDPERLEVTVDLMMILNDGVLRAA